MRKTSLISGAVVVLALAATAAAPGRVELTVTSIDGHDVAVSGWVGSDGQTILVNGESTPWVKQLGAKGLDGFLEVARENRVRVSARVFKGPLALNELTLVGSQISFVNRGGVLSGRAR